VPRDWDKGTAYFYREEVKTIKGHELPAPKSGDKPLYPKTGWESPPKSASIQVGCNYQAPEMLKDFYIFLSPHIYNGDRTVFNSTGIEFCSIQVVLNCWRRCSQVRLATSSFNTLDYRTGSYMCPIDIIRKLCLNESTYLHSSVDAIRARMAERTFRRKEAHFFGTSLPIGSMCPTLWSDFHRLRVPRH
jgi:hypothetical protein